MAAERIDVLAVMDAFAATPAQICCGIAVGGGMDENGNGEPPSCCGQPFDTDMLREARAAVSELIEKAEALATAVAEETEYFATHKHLDEASFFENRVVQCTDELRAALARVQGGQL